MKDTFNSQILLKYFKNETTDRYAVHPKCYLSFVFSYFSSPVWMYIFIPLFLFEQTVFLMSLWKFLMILMVKLMLLRCCCHGDRPTKHKKITKNCKNYRLVKNKNNVIVKVCRWRRIRSKGMNGVWWSRFILTHSLTTNPIGKHKISHWIIVIFI